MPFPVALYLTQFQGPRHRNLNDPKAKAEAKAKARARAKAKVRARAKAKAEARAKAKARTRAIRERRAEKEMDGTEVQQRLSSLNLYLLSLKFLLSFSFHCPVPEAYAQF